MNLPTYKSGLLQVKAYRILQLRVTNTLAKFGLSTNEWAILGYLSENKDGKRLSEFASLLQVEAPFITALSETLEKKKLVVRHPHPQDKRAKLLFLTTAGRSLVPQVESSIREKLSNLLQGVSAEELRSYQKVLEAIISNSPKGGEIK